MGFLTTIGLMCWSIYFGHMLVCWTIRKLFGPLYGHNESADESVSEYGSDDGSDHGFDRTERRAARSTRSSDDVETDVVAAIVDGNFARKIRLENRTVINGLKIENLKMEVENIYVQINRLEGRMNDFRDEMIDREAKNVKSETKVTNNLQIGRMYMSKENKMTTIKQVTTTLNRENKGFEYKHNNDRSIWLADNFELLKKQMARFEGNTDEPREHTTNEYMRETKQNSYKTTDSLQRSEHSLSMTGRPCSVSNSYELMENKIAKEAFERNTDEPREHTTNEYMRETKQDSYKTTDSLQRSEHSLSMTGRPCSVSNSYELMENKIAKEAFERNTDEPREHTTNEYMRETKQNSYKTTDSLQRSEHSLSMTGRPCSVSNSYELMENKIAKEAFERNTDEPREHTTNEYMRETKQDSYKTTVSLQRSEHSLSMTGRPCSVSNSYELMENKKAKEAFERNTDEPREHTTNEYMRETKQDSYKTTDSLQRSEHSLSMTGRPCSVSNSYELMENEIAKEAFERNTDEPREHTTNEYMRETKQDSYKTTDSLQRSEHSLSMTGRPCSVSNSYELMENEIAKEAFKIKTKTTESLETLTETTVQLTNNVEQLENTNESQEQVINEYERFLINAQANLALIGNNNKLLQLSTQTPNSNEVTPLPMESWETEHVTYSNNCSREWSEHSLPKKENTCLAYDTYKTMEYPKKDEEAFKIKTETTVSLETLTGTSVQLTNNVQPESVEETLNWLKNKYVGLTMTPDPEFTLFAKENALSRLTTQAQNFNKGIPQPQTPSMESADEENSIASEQSIQKDSLNNSENRLAYTQFLLREAELVTYPAFGSPEWIKQSFPTGGSTSSTCDTNKTMEYQTEDLEMETETAEGLQTLTETTEQSGSAEETLKWMNNKYVRFTMQEDPEFTLFAKEGALSQLATQAPNFKKVIPQPQTPSMESADEENSVVSEQVVQKDSLNNNERRLAYTQFLLEEANHPKYPAFSSPEWVKQTFPTSGSTTSTCNTNKTMEYQTETFENETVTAEDLEALAETAEWSIHDDEQSGNVEKTRKWINNKYVGFTMQEDPNFGLIAKEDTLSRLAPQAPNFNKVIPRPQTPSMESADEENSVASEQVLQIYSLNNSEHKLAYTQFLLEEANHPKYPAFSSPEWVKQTFPTSGSTTSTCDTNKTMEYQTETFENESVTAEDLDALA